MKGFCRYVSSKRKSRENTGPLLNRAGNLQRTNTENIEVPKAFTWAFIHKICLQQSQAPETSGKVQSKEYIPLVEEGQVRESLHKLDIDKSMAPGEMHCNC